MLLLRASMASLTTIRDMNMNENNTRPTPETDYEESIDNGDTKPLLEFARKLERERDEAREIALNLQNIMGMKV